MRVAYLEVPRRVPLKLAILAFEVPSKTYLLVQKGEFNTNLLARYSMKSVVISASVTKVTSLVILHQLYLTDPASI